MLVLLYHHWQYFFSNKKNKQFFFLHVKFTPRLTEEGWGALWARNLCKYAWPAACLACRLACCLPCLSLGLLLPAALLLSA